jgi:hypothetical protein
MFLQPRLVPDKEQSVLIIKANDMNALNVSILNKRRFRQNLNLVDKIQ